MGSCGDHPMAELPSSDRQHYDPSRDGETFLIKPKPNNNTWKTGLSSDQTYHGGNLGYLEEIEEDASKIALSNYQLDKGLQRLPVRDLFINTSTIKKAFINNTKLVDAMKEICKKVKEDSGGIIDLHFSANDYSNTKMALIDKNWVESEIGTYNQEYFMFNINSRNTLVKSFDLEYKLPSDDYSAALAIQAMTGTELVPTDTTMDYILSDKMLYSQDDAASFGLRYQPYLGAYQAMKIQSYGKGGEADKLEIYDPFDAGPDVIEAAQNFYNILTGGRTITPPMNNKISIDSNDWNAFKSEGDSTVQKTNSEGVATSESETRVDDNILSLQHLTDNVVYEQDTEEYYLAHAKREYFYHVGSTLLPFEVNLRIYGVSSLLVGDTFTVSYLPEKYRKMVYFQITGISHNIENTGWTTEITSVMRMRSQIKKNANFSANVVATNVQTHDVRKNQPLGAGINSLDHDDAYFSTSTAVGRKIVINPRMYWKCNMNGIINPQLKKIGLKYIKDIVPLSDPWLHDPANASAIAQTSLSEHMLKFTYDSGTAHQSDEERKENPRGPAGRFTQFLPIHVISDMGSNPGLYEGERRWKILQEHAPKIMTDNPNMSRFDLYGDKPPWTRKDQIESCCRLMDWNLEKRLEGTLQGVNFDSMMEKRNPSLMSWIRNNARGWYGDNNHRDSFWCVDISVLLVSGQDYYMLFSKGFSQVMIFPLETNRNSMMRIMPVLFPVEGLPLFGYKDGATAKNYYEQYNSGLEHMKMEVTPIGKIESLRELVAEPPM